jgi:hypothetical protein
MVITDYNHRRTMPITGWYCNKCRARVPLDHWADGACDAVHADFAAAVLVDSHRDRGAGVHVTGVIGCPRKSAMEATAEVYIDPLTCNSILGGTAWHGLMAASGEPGLCEVEVRGAVAGVQLVGRVDRLHPPLAISDWKVTSEWAEKWLNKPKDEGGGMKGEHLAQLSLYAELVEQSLGWRPVTGTVWYRTHKAMVRFTEVLWPLDEVLDFHPLGGEYSVAELIAQAAAGIEHGHWRDLPLAGESMAYGQKSACDYCSMREPCWTQAKSAPF